MFDLGTNEKVSGSDPPADFIKNAYGLKRLVTAAENLTEAADKLEEAKKLNEGNKTATQSSVKTYIKRSQSTTGTPAGLGYSLYEGKKAEIWNTASPDPGRIPDTLNVQTYK